MKKVQKIALRRCAIDLKKILFLNENEIKYVKNIFTQ